VAEESDLDKYFADIDPLIAKVDIYRLDHDLKKTLIRYFIKKGAYDKADNALYNLMEDKGFTEDPKEYGSEIYKALLLRTDAELERGNMTRGEILESLEALS
jgi:hypothetical protein